ncbi:MAG: hemolysin family protein [Anaerolineae bacterium]|nr:hemolysin family protein [Anaerolineae bacterium]MCO5204596.1 hemolysin family protein [Anaerolineae bacterium]
MSNLLPLISSLFLASEVSEPLWTALWLPLIVIIVLVLINGFFVSAEFAILGARASRMERLAADGDTNAGHVQGILESSEKQNSYLATAQLGITVVTLALAMYGEPRISHFLEPYLAQVFNVELSDELVHTLGYLISLGVLTYLHVVIGEMVPKSMALTNANELVLRLDPGMRILQKVFDWPIRFLNSIGTLLLRIFRIPPAGGHSRLYSAEEIEQLVSESTEGGLIAEEAEAMIRRIFDFSERTVGQLMTPRRKIQAVPTDIAYDELVNLVVESRHSRLPVYEHDLDHVVGTLYLKDLMRQHVESGEPVPVTTLMRPEVPIVPEDFSAEEMLLRFKSDRLHLAMVLDEFGGMAGLVTLEDLVEEVVGEVRDEFDVENEPYVVIKPGVAEMSGDYLLAELLENVYLGKEESLPEVDTIGGLIVTLLGRPPQVGDVVPMGKEIVFTVIAVDGRAVSRAKVEYPALDSAENDAES